MHTHKHTFFHSIINIFENIKVAMEEYFLKLKEHVLNDAYFDHETVLYSSETALERMKRKTKVITCILIHTTKLWNDDARLK